jgi:hypothetical protein
MSVAGPGAEYVLHGYRLVTDVPLPGLPAVDGPGADPVDGTLRVRHAGSTGGRLPSDGQVLADLCDPQRRQVYRFTATPDRLLLRFTGAADVVADPLLRDAVAATWPGVDPGVLSVLLPGTVLAARLLLDGHLVLHASAFQVGDAAVAVVGRSGMGKSTLAGLAVLAGYRLVSDDVLRVAAGAGRNQVWPGATEARLRASARDLVPAFAAAGSVRTTADARTAVGRPGDAPASGPLPLRCCVVPFPTRDAREVRVRRLAPFEALRRLSGFPRVVGWCDPATSAQQFQLLGDLCERTPVVEAVVPWGPPFDPDLVHRLVAALPAD